MVDQRYAVTIHNIEDENWYESEFRIFIAENAHSYNAYSKDGYLLDQKGHLK
jgi:hypothetical protein